MRPVVHRVLEDHSNDPSDALDMQKRYELPSILAWASIPFTSTTGGCPC